LNQSGDEYKYWDRFKATYDDDNLFLVGDITHQAASEWLQARLGPDDSVLELACGTGHYTEVAAKVVKEIIATDLAEGLLETARERFAGIPNIKIQTENCYGTSFADGQFDVVVMANLLHLIREPATALEEAGRVLKPSGRILVLDYTSHGLERDEKKAMMRRYFSRWGEIPTYSFAATPENLTALCEKAGFTVNDAVLLGEGCKVACVEAVKGRINT